MRCSARELFENEMGGLELDLAPRMSPRFGKLCFFHPLALRFSTLPIPHLFLAQWFLNYPEKMTNDELLFGLVLIKQTLRW